MGAQVLAVVSLLMAACGCRAPTGARETRPCTGGPLARVEPGSAVYAGGTIVIPPIGTRGQLRTTDGRSFPPDQVALVVAPGTSRLRVEQIAASVGGRVIGQMLEACEFYVRISARNQAEFDRISSKLEQQRGVKGAFPVGLVKLWPAPPDGPPASVAAPASPLLPDHLSAIAFGDGMRRMRLRVMRCYDRFKIAGMVAVEVTVAQTGQVTDVKVRSRFAGTPTGECVATAVKRARFAAFNGPPTTLTYPFLLRPAAP